MTPLVIARLAATVLGIFVWVYGFQTDRPAVRLVGMAILVVGLLLRFAGPRPLGRGERIHGAPDEPSDAAPGEHADRRNDASPD